MISNSHITVTHNHQFVRILTSLILHQQRRLNIEMLVLEEVILAVE